VEATRARLLSEARVLVCTDCWTYVATVRAKDLPERPACPRCGSKALGVLDEDEDNVYRLAEKASTGSGLTKQEERLLNKALETAYLVERFGKTAFLALCGKGIRPEVAERILEEEPRPTDRFYELVMEAERRALLTRFRR